MGQARRRVSGAAAEAAQRAEPERQEMLAAERMALLRVGAEAQPSAVWSDVPGIPKLGLAGAAGRGWRGPLAGAPGGTTPGRGANGGRGASGIPRLTGGAGIAGDSACGVADD